MDNSQEWKTVGKKGSRNHLMSSSGSNSSEYSLNNGTNGYDRGPDIRSDLNGTKDRNQSEESKSVTRIQKAISYEEMKKMDLSSYKIANCLTEAGYVVEEVRLSKRTRMCSICTNCTEEASEMKAIQERLKSSGYKLCVVELDDGRENGVQLMAGSEPTATFAVVIEIPRSANKRSEKAWCTSTLILEGKTSHHGQAGPSESEYIHFCLTTFHVLNTILRDSANKGCRGDLSSCDCYSYEDYVKVFEHEGQCSHDLMSSFIDHCNSLITSRKIFVSLLKQNGQRIPVSSIIAAEFNVAVRGDPTQDWISDGMLLKLQSADVANFFAPNAENHLIQTAHNKQRSVRQYAGHEYIHGGIGPTRASLAYICNCQPLSFIDEDITTAFDTIRASEKSPAWYKKNLAMISETRLPEEGNSGSLLSLVEENLPHDALAIGSFHGRKKAFIKSTSSDKESYTEYRYFFIPLKEQLEKLVNLYNNSEAGRENPLHSDSITPYPCAIDYNKRK